MICRFCGHECKKTDIKRMVLNDMNVNIVIKNNRQSMHIMPMLSI